MTTTEKMPPTGDAAGPATTTSAERRTSIVRARLARLAPALAAVLLAVSLLMPYWSLVLHAPQYPGGLDAVIFTDRLEGDVEEIDELNHYIGMMRLGEAARIERSIAPVALVALVALGLAAALVRSRWAILLAIPIVGFPIAFVADLYYWLNRAGHELDPHAPLSSSIRPFTPHLLGVGRVGQFSTTAQFEIGFYLSVLAALLVVASIVVRVREQPA